MSSHKQQLNELFAQLDQRAQQSLLDFARFLAQESESPEQIEKAEPLDQPRPEDENVVNAIKRLRSSYFMLDTDKLLNETSSLMAQFMIQGRAANEVIDDLEALFQTHYQKYLDS